MKIGLEYRIYNDETTLEVISSSTTPHRNEVTQNSVKVWLRPGDSFEVYPEFVNETIKVFYDGDEHSVKLEVE